MAINKNSNAYIIIYTVVMVVIVGSMLAFVATWLKPTQDANVLNEQKVSIMKAFGEADANFDEVVTMGRVTDGELTVVDKADKAAVKSVFDLLRNRKNLSEATTDLPIFVYVKDGVTKYVLPIVGKGLWGDIWGYVSLQQTEDNVVITGIVMDHAGETPGLGAEIATEPIQKLFEGKALYNADNEFAVRMQKGGAQNEHQVDAITGGTKTCDGVNAMLATSIGKYESFLRGAEVEAVADTEECACCEECCAEECCEATAEECYAECEANVEPVNVEEE